MKICGRSAVPWIIGRCFLWIDFRKVRAAMGRRLAEISVDQAASHPWDSPSYAAGRCARRKRLTFSIVLAFSSGGSRHGNTVMSAFGQSEAASMETTYG